MPVALWHAMAALIPDWIWRLLPDSMGGYISLVWLVLFWILRHIALLRTDRGSDSSPYRGLLCSAAAFCGAFAVLAGGLVLVALYNIQTFGLILLLLSGPISLFAALISYLFYVGAWDGTPTHARPS